MTIARFGTIASGISGNLSDWDFDDDFTYANQAAMDAVYISNNTTNINGSQANQNLFYTGANLSEEGLYVDPLGANLSDTANVTRYIWDIDSFTKGSNNVFIIGLQSITNVDSYTERNGLLLRVTGSGNYLDLEAPDNEGPTSSTDDHRFSWAPAEDLTGIEQIRLTSTTATLELFDTPFNDSREASGTLNIENTNINWRYWMMMGTLTGGAVNTGTIQPNLQVADGVTVAP